MDALIYLKETVLQPSGAVDKYVDDVFDFHVTTDSDDASVITGAETVEGTEELKQQAMFAALKQYGSDPVSLTDGVQWAEAVFGEVASSVVMYQVQSAVSAVSSACSVVFTATSGSTLGFYIEVTV